MSNDNPQAIPSPNPSHSHPDYSHPDYSQPDHSHHHSSQPDYSHHHSSQSPSLILPPGMDSPPRRKRKPTPSVAALEIPRWFIILFTGGWILFMSLFVPWAAWVSLQLVTVLVRLEATSQTQASVDTMQAQFHAHISNPSIHSNLQISVDAIDKRLERLERTSLHSINPSLPRDSGS